MTADARVRYLNERQARSNGRYVLYWARMNRRVDANHALAHASRLANGLGLPLLCYERLASSDPCANDRRHTFVLQGVPDTERRLRELGIGYVFDLQRGKKNTHEVLRRLTSDAAMLVTDDYPDDLAPQDERRELLEVSTPCHAVDASCVVPMNLMEKQEYAAYTIRPKIRRILEGYLKPVKAIAVDRPLDRRPPGLHTRVTDSNITSLVAACEIDHSVPPSLSFRGGRLAAEKQLEAFLRENLRRYARHRNNPASHATSNLSPYLHFGQISSLETAIAAGARALKEKLIADEFLEELIVRRELAFNFTLRAQHPDSLEALPTWAQLTLNAHARDKRPFLYTREAFEGAQTHDPLWNATQKEMLLRGKIHGYYRMYWGKKIIEWSPTCQEALATMLYIHDRHALDGRDPNTYAGILWCFGLHDRPWPERPVFGKIRYMSLEGMRRKTDVDTYIREVADLESTGWDPFRVE